MNSSTRKWLYLLIFLGIALIAGGFWWLLRKRSGLTPSGDLRTIEQYARTHPNNLNAQIAWGNALMLHGYTDQSMQVFAYAAQHWPQDARPYIGLGVLAIQQHHNRIAQANFEQAVRCDPKNALVWHLLGETYERNQKPFLAIQAYQKATQLAPQDAVAWRQLGVLETKHKLYAAGYAALQRATTLAPNDVKAQIDFGNIAIVQGQLLKAQQAFTKALQLHPHDPDALIGLANVDMLLDSSPAGLNRALSLVQQVTDSAHSDVAFETLGHIYLLQKRYSEAIHSLKEAIKANSKRTTAYVLLSQAYAAMGDAKDANKAAKMYQYLLKEKESDTAAPIGMGH